MIVIERSPGEGLAIGRYVVRVLAVRAGEVVLALSDPEKDCCRCGEGPGERHRCPVCAAAVLLCAGCAASWACDCGG